MDLKSELVFDVFVNGEYKRTFVNDIQINEFCKRVWSCDELAQVEIKPAYRYYVQLEGAIHQTEIKGTIEFD